jgi:hypothetical protein
MKLVRCNDFVKRQTKKSNFSHFDGNWYELEGLVISAMSDEKNIKQGYKGL